MKVFPVSQIAGIDRYTMEKEPIADIDLMERAARAFFLKIERLVAPDGEVWVYCGPGNNGGDGLAVSRMLSGNVRRKIKVLLLCPAERLKGSPKINYDRISNQQRIEVIELSGGEIPLPDKNITIIDALFGSGLNRPLEGLAADVVKCINRSGAKIISIDIPSGLMGENNEGNRGDCIIHAQKTITFQFPKLSFFFPGNEIFTGKWEIADIGLHPGFIDRLDSEYGYLTPEEMAGKLISRSKFSHKGNFGHALLISGSYGRMGAAILASRACLRSGTGLLTTHVPHGAYPVLQTAVPESMASIDESDLMFTSVASLQPYSAIGVGPAIGFNVNTQKGLHQLIREAGVPMVFDADALTILGQNREWLEELPPETILTPHPKEFERMFGESRSGFERVMKAREKAASLKLIIVLKGAYTAIAFPDGKCWFNSTGNPGMATAGSGDVLTGILLGLLAQGYSPKVASLLGVYIHGLAGDLAATEKGQVSLIASDLTDHLGKAFKTIEVAD